MEISYKFPHPTPYPLISQCSLLKSPTLSLSHLQPHPSSSSSTYQTIIHFHHHHNSKVLQFGDILGQDFYNLRDLFLKAFGVFGTSSFVFEFIIWKVYQFFIFYFHWVFEPHSLNCLRLSLGLNCYSLLWTWSLLWLVVCHSW